MKKKLLFLLCCAATMVGCATDPYDLGGGGFEGAMRIEISGAINQQYTTRVDDGGFCNGDEIGLYGVNYSNENTVAGTLVDEGNQVDNARYTFDEANNKWNSAGNIYYKDVKTNIDLYAYYPYAHPNSVSQYAFEVAQDQSGNTTVDGYAASDFLWAKAEGVVPSENKVYMHFTHRMALATVELKEGSGFAEGEFEALEKGVLAINTTRTATIDLSNGLVTATGQAQSEGTVMRKDADGFRAIVVPQGVDAGVSLFTITVGGVNYRFKHKTLNEQGEWVTAPFNFIAGKQSKFIVTVNKKSNTGDYEFVHTNCQISDWVADNYSHDGEARQYYSVHLDEPGTLEAKILADGKNPAKIKNLKVSGKICAVDFCFMRDMMDILKAINLKESKIVESWYHEVRFEGESGYHTLYILGAMPQSWTECSDMLHARAQELGKKIVSYVGNQVSCPEDAIPNNAYDYKSSLVSFVFPEVVTKIGESAFRGTTLSGALIIPDDCVEIGNSVFYQTNISSLDLSPRLRSIGQQAFAYCQSLAGSLVLPESLESIGGDAFVQCGMLSGNLVLPSKLTTIPTGCFSGCGFTGDLVIPESVTEILPYAFQGCKFDGHLTLSKSIKKIEGNTFLNCKFQGELVIPKSVQIIGDNAFSSNSFSSIIFEQGSELVKIEASAFGYNSRLSEPVVLPEGLMTIGESAFRECRNIPAVTISSTVTTIGRSAFSNCYYITSFRCDAAMPPVVGSGAFDGVGKDNLTLQVPEQSVPLYQTANGWADFKRISPYYDFSISRKHIRALNAEFTNNYMLRVPSGEPWKVESCPEWVSVTPSSGVGRTEVTITVSEMARTADTFTFEEMDERGNWTTETHKGRAGDIVFLLTNKEQRVNMTVQQYDCDNYDGEVIVNQYSTAVDRKKGVNLVFMGDCFDARDIAMGSYLNGINEAIGYFFAIEPYKTYRDHFNVYTVVGMSVDSGMGSVNTIKDAKFGSQYTLDGLLSNTDITFEYAMKAETVKKNNLHQSLIVMVENTTDYGGITYMWGDGTAIAVCPMSRDAYPFDYRGIVQHEAGGHGFAKLGDEYIYHNAFIQTCGCPCCSHLKEFYEGKSLGWYRNLSDNGDHNTVEWAHLFAHPDYMDKVDMYEGGYFHTRGIYRSEANSCMNNNVPYYSAISRQEMVERIMRYSGQRFSITKFYAKDVRDASNNDFVTKSVFSASEPTITSMASAAKQMPPKFMGNSPFEN